MENKNKQKVILDWVVGVLALAGVIVCCCLSKCKMDLPIAIVSIVVIVAGTALLQIQNKKINA